MNLEDCPDFIGLLRKPVVMYNGGLMKIPEVRFWEQVDKTETCWNWTGCGARYGYFSVKQMGVFAHRMSYILAYGKIPEGMSVCHHCDNPKCVRPDHLFLGTQKDNIRDMMQKQRHLIFTKPESVRRGTRITHAKLTEKQVFQLRRIRLKGVSVRRIADWVKMDIAGIGRMLNGEKWTHVPMPKSTTDTYEPCLVH